MKKLSPSEELEFLKEIYEADFARIFSELKDMFATLHTRSQMLLGLATICLTITGFSGPRIAQSSVFGGVFIGLGLLLVLLSVTAVIAGPLHLRWASAWRAGTPDETVIEQLRRRNQKTALYKTAMVLLVAGLFNYLISLILFLITIE
ncbi:MAG: hypothetical protein WC959_00275 [Kiritimatiellales bacterium]